jgi:F-type H+-transporting ATPase subunit alpha
MPVGEQVAILYCGTHGLLRDLPLENVADFQNNFLEILKTNYKESVIDVLAAGQLTDEVCQTIEKVAAEVASQFKN